MQGDGDRGLRETFAIMGDSSPAAAQDAESTLRSGVKDLVDGICTPLMSAQRKAPTAPVANTTCTLLEVPAPLAAAAAAAAAQAAAAAANTTCSFDELPPALSASRAAAAAAAAAKAAQAAKVRQAANVPQAAAAAGNSTCTLDELPPAIAASRAAAAAASRAAAAASAPSCECDCGGDKPSKLWVHVLANGVAPAEEAVWATLGSMSDSPAGKKIKVGDPMKLQFEAQKVSASAVPSYQLLAATVHLFICSSMA